MAPGFLRRDVDGDDLLAALEQRLEHRLAERLLAVNHDTHLIPPKLDAFPSPLRERLGVRCATDRTQSLTPTPLASPDPPRRARVQRLPIYAASALAGFSGAVIAPDVLISASSSAE